MNEIMTLKAATGGTRDLSQCRLKLPDFFTNHSVEL